jgi:hypothetical protein
MDQSLDDSPASCPRSTIDCSCRLTI